MKPYSLFSIAMVLACSNDEGPQDGGTTAAVDAGDLADNAADDSDCEAGMEGCACLDNGVCIGELVCASQLCVDLGGSEGADEGDEEKPATETSADESGGTEDGSCMGNCLGSAPHHGGLCFCDPTCAANDTCCPDYADACPGQCVFNSECAADEVCNSTQECVTAWGQTYDVCVDLWRDYSPTCWDFDECYADVYYQILYGGDVVFTSAMKPDAVATSWSDCFAMEINSDIDDGTQSNRVWAIAFWDDDVDADDGVNTVCEVIDGGCTYLPLSYLHEGAHVWPDSPAYPFEVWVRLVAH